MGLAEGGTKGGLMVVRIAGVDGSTRLRLGAILVIQFEVIMFWTRNHQWRIAIITGTTTIATIMCRGHVTNVVANVGLGRQARRIKMLLANEAHQDITCGGLANTLDQVGEYRCNGGRTTDRGRQLVQTM